MIINYEELIKNINILLADDDEDYLSMTYVFLKQLGYNVDKVVDGEQAIEKLKTNNYQIALLDYFMPGLNGEEVVKEIRKTNQELIIILQTGFSGQKPPITTMQNLNIQNYHDKTEGIERLHLEIISAVKIFNQQNEIELNIYKTNALGNLMIGVAQEIKANLMSISAGIELTNILVQNATENIEKQNLEKLNGFYNKNKDSLEVIDKVLDSIISQSNYNSEYTMMSDDIMEIINIIIKNQIKVKGINYNSKICLKSNSYISGSINDTIFIICEVISKLIVVQEALEDIELILTEDENNWYFNIISSKINILNKNDLYIIKKIILSIRNLDLNIFEDKIQFSMKKKV